jgi:hypothetical protein
MSTWAPNKQELEELEVFQCKILRTNILGGIFYPNTISNKDLYERCKINTIEHDMRIARWKMLGRTLSMTNKTPAKQAMIYDFSESEAHVFEIFKICLA